MTYNIVKRLENSEDFILMLENGIVSITVLDKKVYYERFSLYLQSNKKSVAIKMTAEEYKVSDMTIRRAIKFMEKC